jgi:hypothetical protein
MRYGLSHDNFRGGNILDMFGDSSQASSLYYPTDIHIQNPWTIMSFVRRKTDIAGWRVEADKSSSSKAKG